MKIVKITKLNSEKVLRNACGEIFGHENIHEVDSYSFGIFIPEQTIYVKFIPRETFQSFIESKYLLDGFIYPDSTEPCTVVFVPYFVQLNNYTFREYFGEHIFHTYMDRKIGILNNRASGFGPWLKNLHGFWDYCAPGIILFFEKFYHTDSKVAYSTIDKGEGEYWGTMREIYEPIAYNEDIGHICSDFHSYLIKSMPEVEAVRHYPT